MVKILAAAIPVLYIAVIWIQSSYSTEAIILFLTKGIDRVAVIEEPALPIILLGTLFELLHLIEFGILFFLSVLALQAFGLSSKRAIPIALFIAAGYSVIDEWHQYFTAGRSASWTDLLKDWAGIVIVWLLMIRHERKKRQRRRAEWNTRLRKRA
ncbi:VanZ family protein [Metabacillus sp. 84]|uniref:VanZ family protein n=1 Tax=Metabacillus sp. 84 TaxID=3404705 RepID=UPI003CEE1DDE